MEQVSVHKFNKTQKIPHFLGRLELDEKKAKNEGFRYKSWATIASHWYANTAVARPHIEFVNKPKETYEELVKLVSDPTQANLEKIHSIYKERISNCVEKIQKIFDEKDAEVIFESNGTTALAFIKALAGAEGENIVSTTDMGRIAKKSLEGEDTSLLKEDFKQPVGLFAPTGRLDTIKPSSLFQVDIYDKENPKSVDTICEELFEIIKIKKPKLVCVPQVSRTGMQLPVRKIGEWIKEFNQKENTDIVFAVDGAQSIGRVNATELKKPLDYCDAYFFVGQKALGSMTVSAIVTKQEFVKKNVKNLTDSSVSARVCNYQFSAPPKEIQDFLDNKKEHFAVSLPEIESLGLALGSFYERGEGETFEKRREFQVKKIEEIHESISHELKQIKGIEVLESADGVFYTPGMLTFKLNEEAKMPVEVLRQKLQEINPPITLSPIYHLPLLRIGLNELREQDTKYLLDSIKNLLE